MTTWIIDPDHSVAAFTVRHMLIASVHGQFNQISGDIHHEPSDISRLALEMEIDATGIYTGVAKRDEHLKSPDFLDVARHPKIKFKSTAIEAGNAHRCKIIGDLTIRGITRPLVMEFDFAGPVKDPFDEAGLSLGISASAIIGLDDYGFSWNVAMEGGFVVGRELKINLELEADRVAG